MMPDALLARFRSQLSRGEPVLFLGAGFSAAAKDMSGRTLPVGEGLAQELWPIAFPGDPFDTASRLPDIYHAARDRNEAKLKTHLRARLSVNAETLPDFYSAWFSIPWIRCYTLNVDDLELAVARRFTLPRPIRGISATSGVTQGSTNANALEVVHLNGAVWDDLADLTFSDVDYAARQARPDAWYVRCATDILTRPVVFVGTTLYESTLWQYVEYRRSKGPRGMLELRPGSYLVTPSVSVARRSTLKELKVDWIQGTAEEFREHVLAKVSAESREGYNTLEARYRSEVRGATPALVSDLSAESGAATGEYLMGHEPTWPDLMSGRAIEREYDSVVYETARAIIGGRAKAAALVLSGTAGSGKSTSLMRLGLRLSAEGMPVYWLDERSNIDPYRLRALMLDKKEPVAILIDDADLWGALLTGWARELPHVRANVLFACALRSSRVDTLLDESSLAGRQISELSMPVLTDGDIEGLIEVLDRHNRLGLLKGRPHAERVEAFRQETGAGRQLLVAMIQATTSVRFRDKVFEEFSELDDRQRTLYGIVCFVHAERFSIDRDEILLASGAVSDNEALNALDVLVRRHLIVREDPHTGYRARHRVVAEELVGGAEFRAFAGAVLEGVCFAFANRVTPTLARTARPWRRLIRFMNHDYLLRLAGVDAARRVYERLETLINWDYHYWLQRGSLEVEVGDLDLAMQFVGQSRSLAGGDKLVETEYGYLLMKKAARDPLNPGAIAMFEEGFQLLEDLIVQYGRSTFYPYHVVASQGLVWSRNSRMGTPEKRALLHRLIDIVKEGRIRHPLRRELRSIGEELEREWMSTALPRP